ncbi:MAG: hypothetical protein ACKVT2_10910 [Saprospiraceae bacterium]
MNEKDLWIPIDSNNEYAQNKSLYQEHILEQYKIYVEMADKISERRNLANVFFLTLNTTIIGVIGFAFEKIQLITPKWLTTFPILAILLLCYVWWRLIKSYRQLNSAKYQVIGELEKRLPASPYWSAEWKALGEGKDSNKYTPLTHLENYIPLIFGIMYISVWVFINFYM